MQCAGEYKKEYWYLTITGTFNIQDVDGIFRSISQPKKPLVLINCLSLKKTTLSYRDRFELVLMAEDLLNKEMKYAVIWPKQDINYFWVNNSKKFGLTVNIFSNLNEGKNWLLSS